MTRLSPWILVAILLAAVVSGGCATNRSAKLSGATEVIAPRAADDPLLNGAEAPRTGAIPPAVRQ
jgi:hypothetical protein